MFDVSPRRLFALALVTVFVATAAHAEYPANRVRYQWDKQVNPYPAAFRKDNRMVIKDFTVETDGEGMQINGGVYVDWEVAAGHGFTAGQWMGLKIDVALSQYRGAAAAGPQIPGQFVTVKTTRNLNSFGLAEFVLPRLTRPLPPGRYVLTASLTFSLQDKLALKALRFCDDWFNPTAAGAATAYDDLLKSGPVYDRASLYVADSLRPGFVDLGKPGAEKILCEDRGSEVVAQVIALVKHREEEKENYKKALDAAKTPAEKAKIENEHQTFLITNAGNIAYFGGEATEGEKKELKRVEELRTRLNTEIAAWEDAQKMKCMVFVDCVVYFRGYQSLTIPGYNIQQAIKLNNNTRDRDDRINGTAARTTNLQLKKEYDKKISDAAAPYPAEAQRYVFDYFKTREGADWDANKFTKIEDKKVVLDVKAWRDYVLKFCTSFLKETQPLLDDLDLEKKYCVQKWPAAFAQAKTARDGVLSLGFAYEFEIRTGAPANVAPAAVNDEFDVLATDSPDFASFIKAAKSSGHSSLQTVINGGIDAAKKALVVGKRK